MAPNEKMDLIESITGVILAGGLSSRMGTNKAFLPYGDDDAPLMQTVFKKLSSIFSRIVLSVSNESAFPDLYVPTVIDHYPKIGPIGGIASILESGEERIFCVACDMPFLNADLIRFQCTFSDDAVIPLWNGRWESLHSLYSVAILPMLQQAIQKGTYKISYALTGANVRLISTSEIQTFDVEGKCFENINTPADYGKLRH